VYIYWPKVSTRSSILLCLSRAMSYKKVVISKIFLSLGYSGKAFEFLCFQNETVGVQNVFGVHFFPKFCALIQETSYFVQVTYFCLRRYSMSKTVFASWPGICSYYCKLARGVWSIKMGVFLSHCRGNFGDQFVCICGSDAASRLCSFPVTELLSCPRKLISAHKV
jgi:hypothetical protein